MKLFPNFKTTLRRLFATAVMLVFLAAAFLVWRERMLRPERMSAGKFPEQIVYVRSQDDIVQGGVIFTAPTNSAKPVAVILIHGWGVNFYEPTYVAIGRALAGRGYTSIAGNTRMHDLGNVEAWRGSKRIRGGGYWGLAGEEVRDLAAWIDFAEAQGFKRVMLVGHSAGAAAVRTYQAERQDPRVLGVVLASGGIYPAGQTGSDEVAEATRLVAQGDGEALMSIPKQPNPSRINVSAGTFLDMVSITPEYKDFFGVLMTTTNPAVTRIRCPLLAIYGASGDVGGTKELELLKSSLARQPTGPSRVDTALIPHTDHMYLGAEAQVAQTIAEWADKLSPSNTGGK